MEMKCLKGQATFKLFKEMGHSEKNSLAHGHPSSEWQSQNSSQLFRCSLIKEQKRCNGRVCAELKI